ncbi:MAG: hypothetical protein K6B69_10415, partial [Lachnospiraceae bacterium]|nr:hypothetical protein [Lachnospiraceae bacterium]
VRILPGGTPACSWVVRRGVLGDGDEDKELISLFEESCKKIQNVRKSIALGLIYTEKQYKKPLFDRFCIGMP